MRIDFEIKDEIDTDCKTKCPHFPDKLVGSGACQSCVKFGGFINERAVSCLIEKTKYKPCPFCGYEKPRLQKYYYDHWIFCNHCGAKTGIFVRQELAEEAWNKRI